MAQKLQQAILEGTSVMRAATYVIASTPRSGSSLLATGLDATGVAGRPEEYFAPEQIGPYKEDWQLPKNCSLAEYRAKVMAFAVTENGVLGIKIHWRHLVLLAQALGFHGDPGIALDILFPAAVFVNIVRADRRAQAISLFRAEATGEWARSSDHFATLPAYLSPCRSQNRDSFKESVDLSAVAPTYEQIIGIERDLAAEQAAWTHHFTTRRRKVLTVRYEELARNYRGEIARVLQFLGADPAHAVGLPQPTLARQSDRTNEHWLRLVDHEHHHKSTRK
jgi:LPS sulfotransferase NodH